MFKWSTRPWSFNYVHKVSEMPKKSEINGLLNLLYSDLRQVKLQSKMEIALKYDLLMT